METSPCLFWSSCKSGFVKSLLKVDPTLDQRDQESIAWHEKAIQHSLKAFGESVCNNISFRSFILLRNSSSYLPKFAGLLEFTLQST